MRSVFISHPFAGDPAGNAASVRTIARELATKGVLPIAPHLLLPQFIDEPQERALALRLCLELVGMADEVRVYGDPTEGMRLEIAEAERLRIPIVRGELP